MQGAAPDDAVLDALRQIVPDHLARVGLHRQPGPLLRCVDVGAVAGLLDPRPRPVVGQAAAVFVVEGRRAASRTFSTIRAARC